MKINSIQSVSLIYEDILLRYKLQHYFLTQCYSVKVSSENYLLKIFNLILNYSPPVICILLLSKEQNTNNAYILCSESDVPGGTVF